MKAYRVNQCACGGTPAVRNAQVAEDAVETWVECFECGAIGGVTEDAYSDPGTAVMNWNAGDRELRA